MRGLDGMLYILEFRSSPEVFAVIPEVRGCTYLSLVLGSWTEAITSP